MDAASIVKAISNVESTYPKGIAGELVVLNRYRW